MGLRKKKYLEKQPRAKTHLELAIAIPNLLLQPNRLVHKQ